ncbi:NADH oxidase [Colletotrichum higginsianum]|nr:NADH oxidase [Colletotrichum higginsianum]
MERVFSKCGILAEESINRYHNPDTDSWGILLLGNILVDPGNLEATRRPIVYLAHEPLRATNTSRRGVASSRRGRDKIQKSGFTIEEATEICRLLEKHKADLVELGCGIYEPSTWHYRIEYTRVREAFFLGFAEKAVPYTEPAQSAP